MSIFKTQFANARFIHHYQYHFHCKSTDYFSLRRDNNVIITSKRRRDVWTGNNHQDTLGQVYTQG